LELVKGDIEGEEGVRSGLVDFDGIRGRLAFHPRHHGRRDDQSGRKTHEQKDGD
jgi:hypothetical protein